MRNYSRFRMSLSAGALACCVFFLIILISSTPALSADYVLIVDASISMKNQANTPGKSAQRRLDVVTESLQSFLQEIPIGSRVYLAAFNRVITPLAELVVSSESDRGALCASASRIETLVQNENESGGTYLWAALDRALEKGTEYANANPERTVILRLLTDGEDNDYRYRGMTAQAIIEALRKKYPLVADSVTLVLLGSMEFHLRGMSVTRVPDFHPSFPPVIVVEPAAPRAGEVVTFSVPANQSFDSFNWSIDQQPKSTERTFKATFREPGVYKIKLAVIAANGQRESGSATVQVGAQLNPSITFMPASPEPGETVTFRGSASPAATASAWLIDGTESGTGGEVQKLFAEEGQHEIIFRVQDAAGRKEMATNRVTVAEKPLAVNFEAPLEVVSGSEVAFKNTTSGRVAEWTWDFGDKQSSAEQSPRHRFMNSAEEPASCIVVLHAKSALGRSFTSEAHKLIIHPSPKPPKASFQVRQSRPKVGQAVSFLDESSGIITSRQWQFADEGDSSLPTPEHVFGRSGEKSIRLTVTGPGGSDTCIRKVTIRARQTPVTVSLVDFKRPEVQEFPPVLDFGRINPDNLHAGTVIGEWKDTIQVAFGEEPEAASAVLLNLVGTNDTFRLQLRQEGKSVALAVPARLRGNSIVQVYLNTNALGGVHQARLTVSPIGEELLLNDTNQPLSLELVANISAPDPGPVVAILVLVILVVVGWVIWKLCPKGIGPKDQVTIKLSEVPDGSKSLPTAVRNEQKFEIANGEIIVFGKVPESPRVQIFDIQAPNWRIRREPRRITLVNRLDSKATSLKSGAVREIKTETGILRRVQVSYQVKPPLAGRRNSPIKSKLKKPI